MDGSEPTVRIPAAEPTPRTLPRPWDPTWTGALGMMGGAILLAVSAGMVGYSIGRAHPVPEPPAIIRVAAAPRAEAVVPAASAAPVNQYPSPAVSIRETGTQVRPPDAARPQLPPGVGGIPRAATSVRTLQAVPGAPSGAAASPPGQVGRSGLLISNATEYPAILRLTGMGERTVQVAPGAELPIPLQPGAYSLSARVNESDVGPRSVTLRPGEQARIQLRLSADGQESRLQVLDTALPGRQSEEP